MQTIGQGRRGPIFGSPHPRREMGPAARARYIGLFNRVAATLEQDRRLAQFGARDGFSVLARRTGRTTAGRSRLRREVSP